jgi:hypothetical protein
MDGEDDETGGFPSAYCCIPLQLPFLYVNQSEAFVAREGVIATNMRVKRMARRLEGEV